MNNFHRIVTHPNWDFSDEFAVSWIFQHLANWCWISQCETATLFTGWGVSQLIQPSLSFLELCVVYFLYSILSLLFSHFMYSGRKKKFVTSVTFQFCPAGPTVKLLHDCYIYTKQSTTFQFLKQLQLCAARINHTTVGIIGVFFIYFYPYNQRFSKLFNSKKKNEKFKLTMQCSLSHWNHLGMFILYHYTQCLSSQVLSFTHTFVFVWTYFFFWGLYMSRTVTSLRQLPRPAIIGGRIFLILPQPIDFLA
jgi:hypothetical protein